MIPTKTDALPGEFSVEQHAESLNADDTAGFWAETRRFKVAGILPQLGDLSHVTAQLIKTVSTRTRFSAADLEAGYRLLCAEAAITPAWQHRMYP